MLIFYLVKAKRGCPKSQFDPIVKLSLSKPIFDYQLVIIFRQAQYDF